MPVPSKEEWELISTRIRESVESMARLHDAALYYIEDGKRIRETTDGYKEILETRKRFLESEEKLLLLRDVLDGHHRYFRFLAEDELNDYIESLTIFLKTEDIIIREAAISTCYLFIQRVKDKWEA